MFAIRADKKREQATNPLLERQPCGFDFGQGCAHEMNGVFEKPIMKSTEERILCGKARVERAHRTSGGARQLGRGDGIKPLVLEEKCERAQNAIARGTTPFLARKMAISDRCCGW